MALTGVSSTAVALVPRMVQGTCSALPIIANALYNGSSAVAGAVSSLASSAVSVLPAAIPSILSNTAANVTNATCTVLSNGTSVATAAAAATGVPAVLIGAGVAAAAVGAYYLATRQSSPAVQVPTSAADQEPTSPADQVPVARLKKKKSKKQPQATPTAEGIKLVVTPANTTKSYTVVVTENEITVTNENDKYRVEILQGQADITRDLISNKANQDKVKELAEKVIDVLLSRRLLNTVAATNVAFSDEGEVERISRDDMTAEDIESTAKPETLKMQESLTTSFKALEITKLIREVQSKKTETSQSLEPKKPSSSAVHDSYLKDVDTSGHCMDASILHQLRGCLSELPTAEEARTEIRQPVIDMLNNPTQRAAIVQKLKADPHFFESAVNTFTACRGKGSKAIENLLKPLQGNPLLMDTDITRYSDEELHNLLLAYATYINGKGVYLDGLFLSLLPLTQEHRTIRVILLEDSVGNKTASIPFMVGAHYQHATVKKHDQPIYIWYNGHNHYMSFDKTSEQGKAMLKRVTETERDSSLRGFFDMISQARSPLKNEEIIKAFQGLKVQHPQAFNKIRRELLTHKQNGETTGSQVLTRLLNDFEGSSLRNVLEVLKEDKLSSLHADPFLLRSNAETNH